GKVSTMTELEGLIRYWESVQKQFSYLLEPSALVHIQNTIKYLKQLQDKER
ncbi:unnamed protein product, partial [marine sediment metagenome]